MRPLFGLRVGRWSTALWLVAWAAFGLDPVVAFSNVEVGDPIANRDLPGIDGGEEPILAGTKVNVFVFFRPGQESSQEFLRDVATVHEEVAEKPVSWVGIVSDRFDPDEVRSMVVAAGVGFPLLVDIGDAFYGELGVILYPVAGLVDENNVLVGYQPHRETNFLNIFRARLLHLLGDISAADLERVLNPPPVAQGGDGALAQRNLKLATMLFNAGKLDKALVQAEASVEQSPSLAAAHALVGTILAAQGDCLAAREAFDRALALDPDDEAARSGREACESGS